MDDKGKLTARNTLKQGYTMRYLISIFLCALQLSANAYWTIDEYVEQNPEQKYYMQHFSKVVQGKAVPLTQAHEKVKIAMLYPGNQITDYWRRSQTSFEARLKELNIDYEIIPVFVGENDVKTLQQKLKELLALKSDYLVFTLNIDGHKKLISQLITNKKPKLILQNITTPLKQWGETQPFMYVGFDHVEGTKLLAKYYAKKQPRHSNYLMLYHNEGYISQMRGDSFIQIFKNDYTLKGSYYTYVNKELAKQIVKEYKGLDKISFIYNCSTDIAVGASEALEELGLKRNIMINGWGGGSLELQMIQEGKLDVTAMRMNDDNGVAMAEAIKLDIMKKSVPTIYSGQFELVDKHSTKEEIEALKQRAFRYSH